MTISEGERMKINPNHTAKKDDFKISVTNKTFEIEMKKLNQLLLPQQKVS